jgi:hypothetical protein
MSTTSFDPRLTEYAPVVSTTDFPVLFPLFSINDLAVFVGGTQRYDLTIVASFTNGVSNDAIVRFNAGVTGQVQIMGRRSPRRPQRFTDGKTVPVDDFNLAFDALTAEVQEIRRDIDETLPTFEGNNQNPRPVFVYSIAQLKAIDTGINQFAVLLLLDATGQAFASSMYFFRTDKDYSTEVANDGGANLYVQADDTLASAGAWVGASFPSPPVIDRTKPLVYQDFYRAKGKDHNAAMTAIFDAMFAAGTDLFRSHVDLQGARIVLEEPVVPTGGGANLWHMSNGRFLASDVSWAGDYMIDFTSAGGAVDFKFINCEFDAQSAAHWIKSSALAVILNHCLFKDNRADLTPGIYMADSAHVKIYNGCRFSSPDVDINPNVRNRIGLHCETGDQKVADSIFNYFKYGAIFDGFATQIDNCHFYQGTQDLLTTHTPGIKFTNGIAGAFVTNLYLDKCFIELSNESNTTQTEIGGLILQSCHTALSTDDTGFAFVHARDYGGYTGACFVTRVIIQGCEFANGHEATVVSPTRLWNPTAFDTSLNDQIIMRGNDFHAVQPQFSEPTKKQTFTAMTQHAVDFTDLTPFGSRIKSALSVVGKPSSGGNQPLDIGAVTSTSVRVDTNANWAGDLTVTASINDADANGVIVR